MVPTEDLAHEPNWLIKNTPAVYYAEAISSEETKQVPFATKPGVYKFKVIEVLKGEEITYVNVKGDLDMSGLWDTTFENHKNFGRHGRLGNIGDCRATPAPEFLLGKKYILFIGGPDDSKKYERVDTLNDGWIKLIMKELGK